jgi:histidyl-tRNA synthetase
MDRQPGFRDFYPEPLPHPDVWSADARQYIFDQWREIARRYGFREYDGPPLESLELYTTKSGAEIIGQLYNFKDKGERDVALRPEMTPTLARMIASHERAYKKPIKWFTIPQLFRYERPGKGRLREHFQLNADIIGETDPAAEAELIALLIDTLRSFRLTEADFVVRLSSRNAWHDYFVTHKGNPAQEYEFYQVVDKLEREDPLVNEQKLSALGFSLVEITAFIQEGKPTTELQAILDNLAARGLDRFVKVDYGVIRGLAYYTGIVFEAFDRKGEFRAICGGGRYDNLVKLISAGKVDLPALGFGMGDVVLLELLKVRGLLPRFDAGVDIFCLIEDETLRPHSLKLIHDLRSLGVTVEYSLTKAKSDKQFKRAQELKATRTVRLERGPTGELTAKLKDLKSREERTLAIEELAKELGSK